jgi:hypothetical protein
VWKARINFFAGRTFGKVVFFIFLAARGAMAYVDVNFGTAVRDGGARAASRFVSRSVLLFGLVGVHSALGFVRIAADDVAGDTHDSHEESEIADVLIGVVQCETLGKFYGR